MCWLRTRPVYAIALALLALALPGGAEDLLVNGNFALSDGQGGVAGWSVWALPGDTSGGVQQVSPGFRSPKAVVVSATRSPALFGLFSRPVNVSALPGEELLFSCYYRTEGEPGAQLSLVGFSEPFLPNEWRTPYLQSESQWIPASRDWSLLSWRFRILPGVRDLVVIFRMRAAGKLYLSQAALRSYPAEVTVGVEQAGVVENPPSRRLVALRITNNDQQEKHLQVTAIAQAPERSPVQATSTVRLAAGQTVPVRLTYAYDYREAHSLRVLVQNGVSGEIYEQRDLPVPGMISASFVSPAFRDTLLPGLPTPRLVITGALNVTPEQRSKLSVSAQLMEAGARDIFQAVEAPPGQFRLEAETPPLISGEYMVRIRGRLGNHEQVIDLPLHYLAAGAGQVGYDERLRLWTQGQPTFARGLYGVVSAADVEAAAAAGFNLIVAPSVRASYDVQEAAVKAGLGVVVSASSLEGDFWRRLQNKWGTSPAARGWLTYARPDWRKVSPLEVCGLYDALGHLSPALPILTTLASPSRAQYYVPGADILVAWSMPVPDSPLRALGDLISYLHESAEGRKPVWAIIQACGSGRYDDDHMNPQPPGRPPTAAEMRALTYLALVRGAQGLIWYSMGVPGYAGTQDYRLPQDAPELWGAMGEVNLQLRWLTPMLLEGTREALPAMEGLELARWQYAGAEYVIAVNTTDRGRVTPLTLFSPKTSVQVLFEDRALEADGDGAIQDSFAPFGVHIYVAG
ncbi:MAG: hypothetical protein GX100_07515 [candidate division WS1 bacterium]|nr:hypothetical protein [candidate division WS1 bacterium]